MDILPMDPVEGVDFLQGDFREQSVCDQLAEIVGDDRVDLVMSDMAPNLSGHCGERCLAFHAAL